MKYYIATSRQFGEVIRALGSNESVRFCRTFLEAWRVLENAKGLKCPYQIPAYIEVFDETKRVSAYLMIAKHPPIVLSWQKLKHILVGEENKND